MASNNLERLCPRGPTCGKLPTLAIAIAGLALGCSQDRGEYESESLGPLIVCVASLWSGSLEYEGDVLMLNACFGETCSGDLEIHVQAGDSCLVPDEDGGKLPPGATPRPSGALVRDVRAYAMQDGIEFVVCASRSESKQVDIDLQIRSRPETNDAAGQRATLEIRTADDVVLVDSSGDIGDAEQCPSFSFDLQGQPLQQP